MSRQWATATVPIEYDYISPSGEAEIRLLPSFEQGELAHARVASDAPSQAASIVGMGELFYVMSGEGELWRATGELHDVTSLVPERCLSIPPGIDYQYRATAPPLEFLVVTAPRWKKENWTRAKRSFWNKSGWPAAAREHSPGPWLTVDLPSSYDYLAPDGSEIRLLITHDAGGVAHCRLPAGSVSSPARHRTVVEVWYVLSGHGQVWREKDGDEEIVEVGTSTVVTLPVGCSFQFRASEDSVLDLLIGTFPRLPDPTEAQLVQGHWVTARG